MISSNGRIGFWGTEPWRIGSEKGSAGSYYRTEPWKIESEQGSAESPSVQASGIPSVLFPAQPVIMLTIIAISKFNNYYMIKFNIPAFPAVLAVFPPAASDAQFF